MTSPQAPCGGSCGRPRGWPTTWSKASLGSCESVGLLTPTTNAEPARTARIVRSAVSISASRHLRHVPSAVGSHTRQAPPRLHNVLHFSALAASALPDVGKGWQHAHHHPSPYTPSRRHTMSSFSVSSNRFLIEIVVHRRRGSIRLACTVCKFARRDFAICREFAIPVDYSESRTADPRSDLEPLLDLGRPRSHEHNGPTNCPGLPASRRGGRSARRAT